MCIRDRPYPSPCHRLDSETAGCMIIAKTKSAQIRFNKLFTEKKIQKTYVAIVHGKVPLRGVINLPIAGQNAETIFERIEYKKSKSGEFYSQIKMYPRTGKTHQLRIHLACLGHPILGDKHYGRKGNILLHKGLFLCALQLCFHLGSCKVKVHTRDPSKFKRFLKLLDT